MKQTLELLLSALKKLENPTKTDDLIKLEEEVIILIKDLTSSITENKYSKDDEDLKSKVYEINEMEALIKNNSKNSLNILSDFIINY